MNKEKWRKKKNKGIEMTMKEKGRTIHTENYSLNENEGRKENKE